MRARSGVLAAALAATAVLVPFAAQANATVTTTSTVVSYIADPEGDDTFSLYTMPADGSLPPTRLSGPDDDVWDAALSPDGTKVAYALADDDFEYDLWVRDVAGTGTPQKIADADTEGITWSPDGSTIAYVVWDWNANFPTPSVSVVPSDGSAPPHAVPGTGNSEEPSFSPSGRQLVVSSANDAIFQDSRLLEVVTIATGASTRLAGTDGARNPVWSPDGTHVLFSQFVPDCSVGIFTVPATGGTVSTVRAPANHFAVEFAVSRDGTQQLWADVPVDCEVIPGPDDPEPTSDLYLGAADGSTADALTATAFDEMSPSIGGGSAPTPDTTAPAAPVIAANGTIGNGSATVTWSLPAGDPTEYVVVRTAHGAAAPASPTALNGGVVVYDGGARSATATGLTNGAVYDFHVFALDAWGNASSVSNVHAARPFAPPTITAMPIVSSVSLNGKFPVRWTGTSPSFQITYGEKTRSSTAVWSAAPVYKTWMANTTGKSATFAGLPGHTYYFQARGLDGLGNTTAPSGARATSVPLNENYGTMAYSSGWAQTSATNRYFGTVRASSTANASMTFRNETASFTVVGDRCTTCGQMRVYVDNVLKATVDTRAATTQLRQVLWAGPLMTGGVKAHTLKIVVVGTAGRPRVGLDGIGLSR